MTDRINGFAVVLEKDLREDDAEALIQAVLQLRGVQTVIPNVAQPDFAGTRARQQLAEKMLALIREECAR